MLGSSTYSPMPLMQFRRPTRCLEAAVRRAATVPELGTVNTQDGIQRYYEMSAYDRIPPFC
jgi:hypothetical protein